ncbi:transporter [Pusillimonas sp. ANT_WB101]|uniref:transporter n=1 Tax=Pusillimonas sp. ANT_WB101 TaxID=2597356 RepID=UPI0021061EB4|nr:transporter [Pusillimonas sp. ANT_WB101]
MNYKTSDNTERQPRTVQRGSEPLTGRGKKTKLPQIALLAALAAGTLPLTAYGIDDAELAKNALNPIAAMISVPFQFNYDRGMGADGDGSKSVLNIQPVIPFSLNGDWNLISRTIVPLIDQRNMLPNGGGDASGLGDVTQSLFFSPKKPTASGWIWGAGPVLLLPTASKSQLGAGKWGLGPTAVVLKQADGWTYGVLGNHIWSVAGSSNRNDVNATFIQPFVSYTTKTLTSFGVNTESSYDWKGKQWSVPINLTVTQILKVGKQPLSIQAGARYWADSPENGPKGWGFRLNFTFLFPA